MTLLVAGCEAGRRPRPSARASTSASACASTGATPAARSPSASGAQLDRLRADGALRRRLPAQGEPLERHGRAAARRPADLRHRRGLRGAARLARGALARGRARLDTGGAAHLRRARARRGARRAAASCSSRESFRALLARTRALSRRGRVAVSRSAARRDRGSGRAIAHRSSSARQPRACRPALDVAAEACAWTRASSSARAVALLPARGGVAKPRSVH